MAGAAAVFGPRLVAHPTATLRAAAIGMPSASIENAPPLPGEPNAVLGRACTELDVLADTLRYVGCNVTILDPLPEDPFACALAEMAVVFENGAVLLRPAAPAHRAQIAWLETQFAERDIPIAGHIAAPGFIDAADVLICGEIAFVGRGERNNALGRSGFTRIAQAHGLRVVDVPLPAGVRSLRSVAGIVSRDSVVCAAGTIDAGVFQGLRTIVVEQEDALGCGVLNLGEQHVLADLRFPRCVKRLRRSGAMVEVIDLYDFARIGVTPSMLVLDLKRV